MIRRIVKMSFQPESIGAFKKLFSEVKPRIEAIDGCYTVDMLTDIHDPSTIFTYSIWESEAHLNAYRKTDFFLQTWQRTRMFFSGKAEAWSLEEI